MPLILKAMNKRKPANELSEIDGVELDLIQEWMSSGRRDSMDPALAQYLEFMEVTRTQITRDQDRAAIIKLLGAPPYSLSRHRAMKVYQDALNFFYVDNEIRAEAWANLYADKMERAANKMRPLIRSSRDTETYAKILGQAAELRLKHRAQEHNLPEEIFKKPVRIYTADVAVLGAERQNIDRSRLAQLIDNYDIPETDKGRILSEAGVSKPVLKLAKNE